MLETIREYALERLAARGDGEAVRRRHAASASCSPRRPSRACAARTQRAWLDRLDAERDNIRAALDWAAGGRRGGGRPQDRLGALALLAAAELRAGGARAHGGAVRAPLRLDEHPREGANDDRQSDAPPRRPRDRAAIARGEPHRASPDRRRPHGREYARASRRSSSDRRGDRFGARPDTRGSRRRSRGSQSLRGIRRPLASRRLSRGARGARRCRANARGGRRPRTEVWKCSEHRPVADVTRGPCADAR